MTSHAISTIHHNSKRSIVIVGPTASGKSAYAVHCAHMLAARGIHAEIISADSRQVYTGLDIGTGKVTREEMGGIPHHMLDVADARNNIYSAYDFAHDAYTHMEDIWNRNAVPIICGGSGLYIDILTGRITVASVQRDDALRTLLEQQTVESLFTQLQHNDPQRAHTIAQKNEHLNKVRVVRALEIALKKDVAPRKDILIIPHHTVCWFGLNPQPELLRSKIKTRLLERLEHGMCNEVAQLHTSGLTWDRMEKLGLEYRYCAQYLQGSITYAELCTTLEQKIWQYSRRQMTYWRRNKDIHWSNPDAYAERDALVTAFLTQI